MEKIMTEIIEHLSHSNQQLARILEAERHVTFRMAELVHGLPDQKPRLNGLEGLLESSTHVTKSVVAYLNSLAELEDAVAESLGHVVKAAHEGSDEE